jgi:hemerythrin-like domain-containing protein
MDLSIADVLGAVHERLDGVFVAFQRDLAAGGAKAAAQLEDLRQGFDHHIRFEEDVLFPAVLEARPTYPVRLIDSLKIDHERIRNLLAELQACLQIPDLEGARNLAEDLRIFLDGHNRDEEYGIYREADRIFSTREQVTLLLSHIAEAKV